MTDTCKCPVMWLPSRVQSIWWFLHLTGWPCLNALAIPFCGIAPGCEVTRSSSIPSFEACSFHSSCVSRKCRRLRLYAVPCAVRMLYNLGVLALFVTLARAHVFRVGFSTRTICYGDRGASSLAVRSWYDLYPSCRCCRNSFTSLFNCDDTAHIAFL